MSSIWGQVALLLGLRKPQPQPDDTAARNEARLQAMRQAMDIVLEQCQDTRAILEAHADGDGHRGFCTTDGTYYEGYLYIDEDEDVMHFTSGGPMGGWDKDFPFGEIDMRTLIPPVTVSPEGKPLPGE